MELRFENADEQGNALVLRDRGDGVVIFELVDGAGVVRVSGGAAARQIACDLAQNARQIGPMFEAEIRRV